LKIEQNISRLQYLVAVYGLSVGDVLSIINKDRKKTITQDDILSDTIHINHLKSIDKIFNKGLNFYLDPASPPVSKDASIFFRKSKFGTELNIGAKKVVNKFEDLKIYLSAISKLADINTGRLLPVYTVQNNPQLVAHEIRKELYPDFTPIPKDFLRNLISSFAEKNILVFEFVETWNKTEKANIDGFFLNPNVIVLKRQQSSFRREIFTLAHELGHYLLNEEEIEEVDVTRFTDRKLSAVERWCNDFAYFFLAGEHHKTINQIEHADSTNDYYHAVVEDISVKTHLSPIAIYTKMLFLNKLSRPGYNAIRTELEEKFRQRQVEREHQREMKKMAGIKDSGRPPKPINSPLLITTIQTAFHEGLINEFDVCKSLNISPEKIDHYLQ
jgi:Zn-dependent peptidase ImmA (M78 family)